MQPKFYNFILIDNFDQDDLRIDASVMHFMQVLNSLMDKDTECRERRLNCKTYVSLLIILSSSHDHFAGFI
jgi:phosphatidylinositol kinase/protein kinase (PI-3  family)